MFSLTGFSHTTLLSLHHSRSCALEKFKWSWNLDDFKLVLCRPGLGPALRGGGSGLEKCQASISEAAAEETRYSTLSHSVYAWEPAFSNTLREIFNSKMFPCWWGWSIRKPVHTLQHNAANLTSCIYVMWFAWHSSTPHIIVWHGRHKHDEEIQGRYLHLPEKYIHLSTVGRAPPTPLWW